jgi:hypothetical protein
MYSIRFQLRSSVSTKMMLGGGVASVDSACGSVGFGWLTGEQPSATSRETNGMNHGNDLMMIASGTLAP